jgi:HAD superfamily hydrolase (TIGR01459 family)
MPTLTPIPGLAAIAARHDAFFVDQFGVLHDGRAAFAGAADALRRLKDAGKRVAILSNSGKRAAPNGDRLATLGFPPTLYDHLVTSGEAAHDWLAANAGPGARVFLLARDGDRSILEGLDLAETADPASADLLLIAGVEPERLDRAAHAALLAPLAARRVPCLCANPDLVMYLGGGLAFAAGAVAGDYAAAGGPVTWFGKPHRPIFDRALALLGVRDPARAAMVGDSPEHDCAGAAGAGCGWVLVEGGAQAGAGRLPDGPGWSMRSLRW